MSILRVLVYVNVLIALLACHVLSVRQGQGDDSVGVKSKLGFVQKVVAHFFGCGPITTASATVTCTVKTKEVDCNTKLPVGTQATFRCDNELQLTKSYNTVECKRGKKWDPQPPECLPSSDPETIATAETSTVVTQSTAASTPTTTAIPTTTTKYVRENHVNPFPTKPALLPTRVKTYEGVGTLSALSLPPVQVGQNFNVTAAKNVCKKNNAQLMYLETGLARDALESMMILSNTTSNIWLDSTFDSSAKKYYPSPGVELNPGLWCAPEPSFLPDESALFFGYYPDNPTLTYCVHDIWSDRLPQEPTSVICRE